MYFVSGRSLNSSRETEFGASRSLADFYQRREQVCSLPVAFKNVTVRERPVVDIAPSRKQPLKPWELPFRLRKQSASGTDDRRLLTPPGRTRLRLFVRLVDRLSVLDGFDDLDV